MIVLLMLTIFIALIILAMICICKVFKVELLREEDSAKAELWRSKYQQIAGISILFAIIFVICMYDNVESYTYAICVLAYLAGMKLVLEKLDIPMKAGNYVCGIVMFLAALSSAFTEKWQIQALNHFFIFGAMGVFVIISYIDMEEKDIMQWCRYVIVLGAQTVVSFVQCLIHLKYWRDSTQEKRNNVKYIIIGVACGLPLLCVVLPLLLSADDMFASMFKRILHLEWFGAGIHIFLMFMIAFCGFYGLAYSGTKISLCQMPRQEKKQEPVIAITASAMVLIVYLMFCVVQIRYLFLGGIWKLPREFTYAEYARQGFFQLLFVSVINYIMVLVGTYRFKESKILRRLLVLISACTYVMICSSFYRMLLYVKAYHLTFLRIVVLYFLVELAVVFAFLLAAMYAKKIKLLKYTVLTAIAFYLVFSFAKPDYWVAYYNTTVWQDMNSYEWYELKRDLSIDAAPVLYSYVPKNKDDFYEEVKQEYKTSIENQYEKMSLRRFNMSVYLAKRAVKKTQ